jgi:nicotinate (nicotinamide) nucleotide adenylyltransferase
VTTLNVPGFNAASKSGLNRPVVAVYGGAFDPIHYGHLGCIQALLGGRAITENNQTHIIDQVWVVPSEDHRSDKRCICPQATRLHLCRLAIKELNLHNRGVAVDTITRRNPDGEVESGTMALLDALSSRFPEILFFPVIGSELVGSLSFWKQSLRLAREATFIVIERRGIPASAAKEASGTPTKFRTFDPVVCSLPTHSSSSIRALLETGHCSAFELSRYIPTTVAQYILDHQLYRGSER